VALDLLFFSRALASTLQKHTIVLLYNWHQQRYQIFAIYTINL
jgi:hypothetical protein